MMDFKARYSTHKITGSSSSTTTTQSEEEMGGLRRGPWTAEEDFNLINYIATHGEGRWNSLARCAGLKRTGKSCRLRWLNYLRPDVRRGNITLEEQLMILELHSRWGNRWSKIAQHLPGRTDNEIKNYWRTRVQKHAKQLKCDVNSKQFKDTMRYLWMPRLIERIQAANTTAASSTTAACTIGSGTTTEATHHHHLNDNTNTDVGSGQWVVAHVGVFGGDFGVAQVIPTTYNTPETWNTAASSESFGTHIWPNDHFSLSVNPDNLQPEQVGYSESMISPSGYFNQVLDFQAMEHDNNLWVEGGYTSDNLWKVEDMWFNM
ncbi:transcription factor MYB108 [Manihot esculenta]|uniref:MYB family protein n=1 Tax=Manihot esculenta TaxID=3983 RepID=A0A2C9UCQ9_MANES|nr:transcription factor MYB108 [Manihot esculenta]OAY27638.1 hypothetical protein MANES_15G003000v8 [Manihot esculenta]